MDSFIEGVNTIGWLVEFCCRRCCLEQRCYSSLTSLSVSSDVRGSASRQGRVNGSWPLSFFGSRIFCSGDSSGERGAPSIIFLAVSHTFQNFITLHTRTMAEKAAMVWSGTAAGITKIRRQRPQWTVMTS